VNDILFLLVFIFYPFKIVVKFNIGEMLDVKMFDHHMTDINVKLPRQI
jgi:hypothetical protein